MEAEEHYEYSIAYYHNATTGVWQYDSTELTSEEMILVQAYVNSLIRKRPSVQTGEYN